MKQFYIRQENDRGDSSPDEDVTNLMNLLAALRNEWRAPRDGYPTIYSVPVMTLFGQMIAEVERLGGSVFEWDEEVWTEITRGVWGKPPTDEMWNIGDLVCESKTFGQMNPPVVGRIVEVIAETTVCVLWQHDKSLRSVSTRDLVKVGEEYERFAPRDADADSTAE